MGRTQAREQAFIVLFEKDFNKELSVDRIFELAAESGVFEADEYAITLTMAAEQNATACDETITSFLKPGWRLNRLSRVALAVLRIAVAELCYLKDTPVSVVINEAVELAKKYSGKEDAVFVNGMLGQIDRTILNAPESC